MAISNAVSDSLRSKVVGYQIGKLLQNSTQNLPMRIAIIGNANTANQSTLDTNPKEVTSARQAGLLYGFGSPIERVVSILRPNGGSGVSGIPTVVYALEDAIGSTSRIIEISPIGIATGNATHRLRINGKTGVDGQFYSFNVQTGDTSAEISDKIKSTLESVLSSYVTVTATDYEATLETKWKGKNANDLVVEVDNGGNDVGITYTISSVQNGAGVPSISTALNKFGDTWNTIVINLLNGESDVLDALEQFNGVPDPDSPTGRYSAIIVKPFLALYGTTADDPTSVTDPRKTQVTNVSCPAPLSKSFPFEVAADYCLNFAVQAQDLPHTDISGKYLGNTPVPLNGNIGSMAQYINRDAFLKKGSSSVEFSNEQYRVCDFVTTFHPEGEPLPQFRYVRNWIIDMNVYYGYYLLEQLYVVDRVIANDNAPISVSKVIKPKDWKQILCTYFDELESRGLISDAEFSKNSLVVGISASNPDRLETFFRYKRTSFGRILSTTAEAGFNLGTNVIL